MYLYNGSVSDVSESQKGFLLIEVFISLIIISFMVMLCHQMIMLLSQ